MPASPARVRTLPTHPYFQTPETPGPPAGPHGPGFVAMAHRGGADLPANRGVENTLRAFGNAVDLGYRWLETDVHTTADGVLVAFHDASLDRVTDARGQIADLPWSTVRTAGVGPGPDGATEAIPRLDELLEAFPTARFNIDIKAPGAVDPLARAIEQHRAHDRVCVGSFSTARLQRFRRRMGTRVATAVTPAGVLRALLTPFGHRLLPDHGLVFQVPVSHRVRGRALPIVTPQFVRRAHAHGQGVHVWTINDSHEMKRLIDMGVDGLITDRPDLLKDILIARDLW